MTFWVPPEEGSIIVTLGHDSYGHPRGVDLSNVPDPIGILWDIHLYLYAYSCIHVCQALPYHPSTPAVLRVAFFPRRRKPSPSITKMHESAAEGVVDHDSGFRIYI